MGRQRGQAGRTKSKSKVSRQSLHEPKDSRCSACWRKRKPNASEKQMEKNLISQWYKWPELKQIGWTAQGTTTRSRTAESKGHDTSTALENQLASASMKESWEARLVANCSCSTARLPYTWHLPLEKRPFFLECVYCISNSPESS